MMRIVFTDSLPMPLGDDKTRQNGSATDRRGGFEPALDRTTEIGAGLKPAPTVACGIMCHCWERRDVAISEGAGIASLR